jgi:hypothetical protein
MVMGLGINFMHLVVAKRNAMKYGCYDLFKALSQIWKGMGGKSKEKKSSLLLSKVKTILYRWSMYVWDGIDQKLLSMICEDPESFVESLTD